MADERSGESQRDRTAAARRAARDDWFSRQLGDEWEADGDGVYRFVGSPGPKRQEPPQPEAEPEPQPEARPEATEMLDDVLFDQVLPGEETAEQARPFEPLPPRGDGSHGGWWRRR